MRERLRGFLLVYVGGALENPDSVRMMMASAAAGSHPRVDVFERTHVEILRLRELIAQGVATGELSPAIDPGLAISMLVGAANATFVGALLGDAVRPDYADRILDLLYRGVAR